MNTLVEGQNTPAYNGGASMTKEENKSFIKLTPEEGLLSVQHQFPD